MKIDNLFMAAVENSMLEEFLDQKKQLEEEMAELKPSEELEMLNES